jgi:hypothetical protein
VVHGKVCRRFFGVHAPGAAFVLGPQAHRRWVLFEYPAVAATRQVVRPFGAKPLLPGADVLSRVEMAGGLEFIFARKGEKDFGLDHGRVPRLEFAPLTVSANKWCGQVVDNRDAMRYLLHRAENKFVIICPFSP